MLTSQQIVNLALSICKAPGMTQQAGQLLNARLVQLALDQDMDIIRRTETINVIVGTQSYPLPANYLRMREVLYNINGTIYTPEQISLEYYDTLFNGPGEVDFPYYYATDIGETPPLLYLYPSPSSAFTLTIRYMDNLVEITSPETSNVIPWFQDQLLLIKMLAEDMMDIVDDTRATEFSAKNDMKFRNLLQMANDKENRAIVLKKDPTTFRSVRQVKPTKLQGD